MHVKVIIGGQQSITLEIFRFHTLACKSDNWRSVENNTFEAIPDYRLSIKKW